MKSLRWNGYLSLLIMVALFSQCSDPHDRYEDPPWLGGTNIQTLENRGNYTHFLELMDQAGYRVSIENQLFTLFVPNDSAFELYFQKKGISSVSELDEKEAAEIFGQHILINPRSRDQLMYEYAWGELQDPLGEYGTLFLRKMSYSIPLDYSEEVKYDPLYQGQTLKIQRQNTMIPLWTTEYFEDYFGDTGGSDYLFMYPGSSWSGTQWHDAMVTESEVRTSSGFIYFVDRVVEPIPTIDKYLKDHQDQYGLFYDIAQRFATYSQSDINEQLEYLYTKSYNQILDIANEWGPSPVSPAYMLYLFSAFVPTDEALQQFLDETILQYYPTIDEAPRLYLVYLLQSHLNSFLNLPSKMRQRFLNYYGDQIDLDVDNDIINTVMCSNGVIYGLNRFLEPNVFTCVPGPILYNSNYTTFMYALQNAGVLTTLTHPEIDITLFASTNDELLENGIRTNEDAGNIFIQVQSSDGLWHDMETDDLKNFVNDYIHVGRYEDFEGEGYIRMESDNYLYYNNGNLYGGGNQIDGDYCSVTEKIASEKNGNLFYLDNIIKAPFNVAELLMNDPDLSSFAELMYQAGMIDSAQVDYEIPGIMAPRVIFMADLDQWTLFVPDNQAIADAQLAGYIPEDIEELKDFLSYHFIRGSCIFDDGLLSGTFPTNLIASISGEEVNYETLDLTNSNHALVISDQSGQVVNVSHSDADRLVESGVVHKISKVLRYEP